MSEAVLRTVLRLVGGSDRGRAYDRLSMIAGVVDVGSNTVRLLVARLADRRLEPLCTERARLGLGREIEERGELSDVRIAATAKTVAKLCTLARREGAELLEVLVTAPGRQSANGGELLATLERAAGRSGATVRVLSADDEARLAFRGAVASAAPKADLVAVCDLGGASTELAVGRPADGPDWLRSVDLGALRLTARLLEREQPPAKTVAAARAAVAESFAGLVPPLAGEALAVGGTARALRKVVGPRLGAEELAAAADVLASRSHAAIARRYGVDRRRSPLLLAGALIFAEVERRLFVPLDVVDGGVREGALLASLTAVAA